MCGEGTLYRESSQDPAMNETKTNQLLREKLSQSVLFKMYARSFELTTGYRLELREDLPKEKTAVPVQLGKILIAYLVAEPVEPFGSFPLKGLLESFSIQLADEANRALLMTDESCAKVVKQAITYLTANLEKKITLDEVANVVGACSFRLCRLFGKHTGITMTEYVNRLRVERARKRLADPGRQISEIAFEVGFSSLSQFNRNFRKVAGESPSEYREGIGQLEHCQLAFA